MKPFKELTHAEKVALTEEQVQTYKLLALAEEGLTEQAEPRKVPEPEVRHDKVACYRISEGYRMLDVAFRTGEEAEAFLRLKPQIVRSDWSTEVDFVDDAPELTVKMELVAPRELQGSIRELLAERKKIRATNAKMKEQHDKLSAERREITQRVDDELRCVREREWELAECRRTHEVFLGLSGGDSVVAMRFLRRRHGDQLIEEALGIPSAAGAATQVTVMTVRDIAEAT